MKARYVLLILPFLSGFLFAQSISDVVQMIRTGQIQKAKETLAQLEQTGQSSDNLLFLKGLLTSNADSAASIYRMLITRYPDCSFSDDALFRLGQLNYAKGLYRSSRNHFSAMIRDYPNSRLGQKALYWIAQCQLATDQKDSAAINLQKALYNYPKSAITPLISADLALLTPDITPPSSNEEVAPDVDLTPESNTDGQYYIQIGAFSVRTNALLRQSFFNREGYPVKLGSKRRDGATLHLVWLGPYATEANARKEAEAIQTKYGIRFSIIK